MRNILLRKYVFLLIVILVSISLGSCGTYLYMRYKLSKEIESNNIEEEPTRLHPEVRGLFFTINDLNLSALKQADEILPWIDMSQYEEIKPDIESPIIDLKNGEETIYELRDLKEIKIRCPIPEELKPFEVSYLSCNVFFRDEEFGTVGLSQTTGLNGFFDLYVFQSEDFANPLVILGEKEEKQNVRKRAYMLTEEGVRTYSLLPARSDSPKEYFTTNLGSVRIYKSTEPKIIYMLSTAEEAQQHVGVLTKLWQIRENDKMIVEEKTVLETSKYLQNTITE